MRPSLPYSPQWIFILIAAFLAVLSSYSTKPQGYQNRHHRPPRADRINVGPILEPLPLYSVQHQDLSLKCDVKINYTASIWLKDGQMVQTVRSDSPERGSGHRFLIKPNGDLLINTVRLEDDGRWQCEAEDAEGLIATALPVQLTVLDPPKQPYLLIDNRILDPGNLFIPVKENSELAVACVADGGNPRPSLSWSLSLGSPLSPEGPEPRPDLLNLTQTSRDQRHGARSEARLSRVLRAHHNSTISCLVHHMALEAPLNVSLLLDVQYTPSFAISREPGFGFPVREGAPLSLRCEVDSNPRAAPIWQKDDGSPPIVQSPDGYLNFSAVRREHSGWYKCVSKHLLGRFSSAGYFLNVRYEADVTQEPEFGVGELSSPSRQVEVALGGEVQLQCPPGPGGCWTRVGPDGSLEPTGARDLRLERVLYQEAGEYRCVTPGADHVLEPLRSSLSVHLAVKGKPMVYPLEQSITASTGQPATLTMEVCANPPVDRIFWIAGNRVYKPGQSKSAAVAHPLSNSSSPHCQKAALHLRSVSSSDSGEYLLVVRSSNGLAEGSVRLNLTKISHLALPSIPIIEAASGSGAKRSGFPASPSSLLHGFIRIFVIIPLSHRLLASLLTF